jgi:hypothetical protein
MPAAICRECGGTVGWRNQRGSRLADARCHCGGKLQRARPYWRCKVGATENRALCTNTGQPLCNSICPEYEFGYEVW